MNEKIQLIIELLKTLTILDINILIKDLEILFNINLLNSINTNKGSDIVSIPEIIENKPEKNVFNLFLQEIPSTNKMAVLKVVRVITGLGLKESKEIIDNVPKLLKEGITKEESEKFKIELENLGAKVTIN